MTACALVNTEANDLPSQVADMVAGSYGREAGSRAAHAVAGRGRDRRRWWRRTTLARLLRRAEILGNALSADISITGYNDMLLVDLVSSATPSSIQHHQIDRSGAAAVALAEPLSPVVDVVLHPTLVVRESTSPPRVATQRRARTQATL